MDKLESRISNEADSAEGAVVPGATYGSAGNNAVRLVLCGQEAALADGLKRIVRAVNGIEG